MEELSIEEKSLLKRAIKNLMLPNNLIHIDMDGEKNLYITDGYIMHKISSMSLYKDISVGNYRYYGGTLTPTNKNMPNYKHKRPTTYNYTYYVIDRVPLDCIPIVVSKYILPKRYVISPALFVRATRGIIVDQKNAQSITIGVAKVGGTPRCIVHIPIDCCLYRWEIYLSPIDLGHMHVNQIEGEVNYNHISNPPHLHT